jgi:hypothetical protein
MPFQTCIVNIKSMTVKGLSDFRKPVVVKRFLTNGELVKTFKSPEITNCLDGESEFEHPYAMAIYATFTGNNKQDL